MSQNFCLISPFPYNYWQREKLFDAFWLQPYDKLNFPLRFLIRMICIRLNPLSNDSKYFLSSQYLNIIEFQKMNLTIVLPNYSPSLFVSKKFLMSVVFSQLKNRSNTISASKYLSTNYPICSIISSVRWGTVINGSILCNLEKNKLLNDKQC